MYQVSLIGLLGSQNHLHCEMHKSLIVASHIKPTSSWMWKKSSMPSDDSMLDYFNLYETNFEKLKDIAVKYDDFHYPPYNEIDGRTDMIVSDYYEELDSLLQEINIALILSVDSTEVHFLLYIDGGYQLVEDIKNMFNTQCNKRGSGG